MTEWTRRGFLAAAVALGMSAGVPTPVAWAHHRPDHTRGKRAPEPAPTDTTVGVYDLAAYGACVFG